MQHLYLKKNTNKRFVLPFSGGLDKATAPVLWQSKHWLTLKTEPGWNHKWVGINFGSLAMSQS